MQENYLGVLGLFHRSVGQEGEAVTSSLSQVTLWTVQSLQHVEECHHNPTSVGQLFA